MSNPADVHSSRREFLKSAGSTTVALTVGFQWVDSMRRAAARVPSAPFAPNAFVRIGQDGMVTVISKSLEAGQGAYTGLATILAEELDADWAQVRVESAPADVKRYLNSVNGVQGTGGSSSMSDSWTQLREAGAKARAMLLAAAAKEWSVPIAELTTEKGTVRHVGSKRQTTYGSLVAMAAVLPVPDKVNLKDPRDFKLIGQRLLPRVDIPSKVNGTAQYGLDVSLPGMLVAVVRHPPCFGATVSSFDGSAARAIPGVVNVVQIPSGVAVIGRGFWAAKRGRDALKVDWDETHAEKRGSAELMAEYRRQATRPGVFARKQGDAVQAIQRAATTLSASYEFPYLSHAPMEPLDAVVKLTAGGCDIWAGDQYQTGDQANAAAAAGLKAEQVRIHTIYAGGAFGRRFNPASDYIVEAVAIAKACGADGTPIKLQWTREDDIGGGLYRPMYFHTVEAGLSAGKELVGWRHRIVGQSIMGLKDGVDSTSVDGAANIPYAIPNIDVDLSTTNVGIPVLWWRSVSFSHTSFAIEAFIDEVAEAAGQDPFTFRRSLLKNEPRMRAVLELAAHKAGWNSGPLPKGRGRGIAVAQPFGTYLAQVAEVTVDGGGHVRVDRVVCAVDCGIAINPDIIVAQMEGGIGFGLSAALYGAITLKNGRVEQTNFDGYRVLRMNEMPKIEVHIVPSTEPPSGVGEPGVAPVGPAVVNAIYAASGKRVRAFPIVTAL